MADAMVAVTVEGVQVDTAGEKTVLKSKANGRYAARAGKHYVRYEDASLHDKEAVPTVLKMSRDGLTLIRRVDLLVETHKLDIYFQDGEGKVMAEYDLFLNENLQSHNTLNVVINAEQANN